MSKSVERRLAVCNVRWYPIPFPYTVFLNVDGTGPGPSGNFEPSPWKSQTTFYKTAHGKELGESAMDCWSLCHILVHHKCRSLKHKYKFGHEHKFKSRPHCKQKLLIQLYKCNFYYYGQTENRILAVVMEVVILADLSCHHSKFAMKWSQLPTT